MTVCPKPHPLTAWKAIDGYLVLSHVDSEEFIILKGIGARTFLLADGSRTVGEIIRLIASEFQLKVSEARQEVVDSIQELMIHNMLINDNLPQPSTP
jgi:hypothetical protein